MATVNYWLRVFLFVVNGLAFAIFYFNKWYRLLTPIEFLTCLENEEYTLKFVNQIYFQFRNLSLQPFR